MTATDFCKTSVQDTILLSTEELKSLIGSATTRKNPSNGQLIIPLKHNNKEIVIFSNLTVDEMKSEIEDGNDFRFLRKDDKLPEKSGRFNRPAQIVFERVLLGADLFE